MFTAKEVVKRQLDQSANILFQAVSMLSDEEFFFEPEAGASVAWTLNHLAVFQDWVVSNFTHSKREFGTAMRDAFKGGRAILETDREYYGTRSEIIENFRNTQARTINALENFDHERWHEPTPTGCRFPTHGLVWEGLATENYWHMGQLSVCVPRFAGTSVLVPVPRVYSLEFSKEEK